MRAACVRGFVGIGQCAGGGGVDSLRVLVTWFQMRISDSLLRTASRRGEIRYLSNLSESSKEPRLSKILLRRVPRPVHDCSSRAAGRSFNSPKRTNTIFRKAICRLERVVSRDQYTPPLLSISRTSSTKPGMPKCAQVERNVSRKGAKRSPIGLQLIFSSFDGFNIVER